MTEEEIKDAAKRLSHYKPECICGGWISHIHTSKTICDDCGRLYTPFTGSVGKAILSGPKMMETVHVIFNGDVTTHTFTWEL